MAVNLNTDLRNAIADATGARFNGGTLEIRTGAAPGPNAAASGTLLVTLTVSNPAFTAAANGTAASAFAWSGTAVATGAPGHYRLINAGADEIAEGTAGEAGTEDLVLTGLTAGDIVNGGSVSILTGDYTVSQPQV